MNRNYYVIPIKGYSIEESIENLCSIQNINSSDVTLLQSDDKSQIFRIPFIQRYNDLALAITSNIKLVSIIDFSLLENKSIIHDKNLNLFLINCSHEFFKVEYSASKLVKFDTRNDLNKLNNISIDLENYFEDIKLENEILPTLGTVE